MPPPATVIKALALQRPIALPCGHARLKFPSGRLFVDGDTKKPVVQYELSHVSINKQFAQVAGKQYEGFGMADNYELALSKSTGAWELTGMRWTGSE